MPKINLRRKPEASHVTYSDFRERLAAYMDQVWDSRAPLHVTRQGGRAVVVISEEEFDGWMETLHLYAALPMRGGFWSRSYLPMPGS